MRANLSLSRRLMFWYIAGMSFILVIFCVLMSAMMRGHLYHRIDVDLEEEAKELVEEIRELPLLEDLRNRFDRRYAEHGGYSFQIEHSDGRILCGTPWLRPFEMPAAHPGSHAANLMIHDVKLGNAGLHRVLTRIYDAPAGPLVIRVIIPYAFTQQEFADFLMILLCAAIVALAIAAVGGDFLARRALRPIGRLAAAAERLSTDNLSLKIAVDDPRDELGRLATTLNSAFERLRISVTQIRRFTADAAHELRTPLSVIQTRIEVTLRQMAAEDLAHEKTYLVLLEQVKRLTRIVDQMLLLSKLDAGLMQSFFDEVSIRPLIFDVVESLRPIAEKKEIEINVGEIPDAIILGDDISLSRLFYNLLENAIKYSRHGECVSISCKCVTNICVVSVSDVGCGIAEEHLPRIFERFYRSDSSRNNQTGGAGLGLAICHSITASHSGKIKVESIYGKGTTFSVELPAIRSSSRLESFCETESTAGTV